MFIERTIGYEVNLNQVPWQYPSLDGRLGLGWAVSTFPPRSQPSHLGKTDLMKRAAVAFLLLMLAELAVAKPKAQCKAFFMVLEQDEITVNLKMLGLNERQNGWYKKDGDQGEFAEVCLARANGSGGRVPLESVSEEHIRSIVGDSPLYLIAWEEHRVFVPDDSGGHYAFSSNGILSLRDKATGKFVPLGPVHDSNRTILSSSSVSLLKNAIKEIRRKEGF